MIHRRVSVARSFGQVRKNGAKQASGPGGAVNTVIRGLTPNKEGLVPNTIPRAHAAVRQAR